MPAAAAGCISSGSIGSLSLFHHSTISYNNESPLDCSVNKSIISQQSQQQQPANNNCNSKRKKISYAIEDILKKD